MPEQANDDPVMPTSPAAEHCGYSGRHFHRMRAQGEGPPYIKVRGKILYRQSDLDRWLDEHRVVPVRERDTA